MTPPSAKVHQLYSKSQSQSPSTGNRTKRSKAQTQTSLRGSSISEARKFRDPLLSLAVRLISKEVNSGAITVSQIVRRSGVSRSTINNWVHGKTRHPQAITVQFVLKAMGYHIGVIDEAGKEIK